MSAWRILLRKAAGLPDDAHPASSFDDVTLGVEAQKKGLAALLQRGLLDTVIPRQGRRGGLYRVTPLGRQVAQGELVMVQTDKRIGGQSVFIPCRSAPVVQSRAQG